jgi:hypothetical protein
MFGIVLNVHRAHPQGVREGHRRPFLRHYQYDGIKIALPHDAPITQHDDPLNRIHCPDAAQASQSVTGGDGDFPSLRRLQPSADTDPP